MDVFTSNCKENLTVGQDNHIKRNALQTTAIGSVFCGRLERKEQYLYEGSISVGRVKLLKDFYEKSVFLSKNIKIRKTFYDLNPSVKERVKMLENMIVKQRI
ncbi:hypothetical protein EROM_070100 [Encephalitozoon romaleae SJ-2008]|uniref:Uncharacterized protein n=1 Tax=Encephalitozoon romaleae (strain SJ-2008) TaxID=1178016 RepID=I6ZUB9_ENCRO|nr:hypothetical protein EROM_070100 [Encephalitozoon romaleae SJ-2008]AFN83261.1 hypothetical protein EROM_070100 [Encephalitozoon romaleae SJ-2008]